MDRMIELAGRSFKMRYTINSLCAVEDRAGMPIDDLLDRQFSATRLLLWGGLIERQPELTLGEVGELMGACLEKGMSLSDIVDLCAEGLRDAGFFCAAE